MVHRSEGGKRRAFGVVLKKDYNTRMGPGSKPDPILIG